MTDPPAGASCFVRVWEKDQGAALVPMTCVSWGRTARFTAAITAPEEGCLLWYSFVIEGMGQPRSYYGNNAAGLGGPGQMYDSSPKSYQITVYRPNSTPDWYKYGIAYQIFPDRFFRGGGLAAPPKGGEPSCHMEGAPAYPPAGLERHPLLLPQRKRGDHPLGGVRRHPGGHPGEAAVLKKPWVTVLYPQPHFRGGQQPQV